MPMIEVISNAVFVQKWAAGEIDQAILEREHQLIDERLVTLQGLFQRLIAEKVVVAGQSGDDWHDGAFRATDAEAGNLAKQQDMLIRAQALPVVASPTPEMTSVSLGSRAFIEQDGKFQYMVDIVGLSILHNYADDTDELELASLSSPLGKALIGTEAGVTKTARLGAGQHSLYIAAVEPSPNLQVTVGY